MQRPQRNAQRPLILAAAMVAVTAVAGCGQRSDGNTPDGVKADAKEPLATSTAPAPPPATPMPPAADVKPSGDPAPITGQAVDPALDKGTKTGMPGGEAGTVGSSGKPGSGTDDGAGTGPAVSSGDKTVNKK